ncbi:hypothetical protein JWG39_14910 [Desulforhopalus vacuolatus]|uniref:hypothetical protein n=1 Tax=Desulforhopalus vacuolatus TaxID=40414 RepID=UPI00196366A9|nr:hypothetical protein [Desulforhopalus vacuolatus]MBM9521110.1 hypothetical protein [Desulforhopalus vacuolatus]
MYEENDRFGDAVDHWKSGFQSKTQGRQKDIIEISKWIILAQDEKSEMKSFVMLYLAFNSLYSLYSNYVNVTKNKQPKTEIKNLFYNLLTEKRIEEIFKLNRQQMVWLTSLNIISSDKKSNLSLSLKGVLESKCDPKHILYQMAMCVHQIRNDLFHYGIGMKDKERKIEISKFFLITTISRCLRDFISYK